MRFAALLAASLMACSSSESPPDFTGTLGVPVPAHIESGVVMITASDTEFSGPGQEHVMLDTGAPYVLLDSTTHGRSTRPRKDDLHFMGLDFPAFSTYFDPALSDLPDSDLVHMDGIIGASVLEWFAFTIDYHGSRVVLADHPMPPADAPVGATIKLPFRLVGTRILVPLTIEGRKVTAMVDTGASMTGLRMSAATRLAALPGRPRLDGSAISTLYGSMAVHLSRLSEMSLGGGLTLTGVPVMLEDDDSLYASFSQEVGEPIDVLIGATTLREYLTTIDYPDRQLWLAPYTDRSHIDPHEFVGAGFSVQRGMDPGTQQQGWLLKGVYPGHAAEAAGLLPGDVLLAMGGTEVASLSHDALTAILHGTPVGQPLAFRVRHAGAERELSMIMEDLLPSWP